MKFSQLNVLARSLDARAFAQRCPDPALIPLDALGLDASHAFDTPDRGAPIQSFARPKGPKRPNPSETSLDVFEGFAVAEKTPPQPLSLADCDVLFVAKSNRNPFANMITVGRSPNNDLVLNERSVSKVHAYFLRKPDGRWVLHDQPSTNGTFCEEAPVTTAGCSLRDGSRVRFGLRSSFAFYEAAALHRLLIG